MYIAYFLMWFCITSAMVIAIAGLILAIGLLGWMVNLSIEGALKRLGYWVMFFEWCRKEFLEGRYPKAYRWIFGEDLPSNIDEDSPCQKG